MGTHPGRPADTRTRRAPLLVLEAATLVSGAGNGVATVALPWLVLERTGNAAAAGLVAAATALPLLVSSLFSGTVIDLLGRRRTAVLSDVLSGVSVAAIPLVDVTLGLTVPWLVALAMLGAVFDPAGITARETMLPAAARAAGWRLERANGAHEAVWGVAFLLGPGVGGVLIGMVGAVGALWATAAGFTVAALLGAALGLPRLRLADAGRPQHHERPAGLWRGTVEGLAFVWRDRLLRGVGILVMLLTAVYLPIEGVVLPVHFQAQGAPGRLGLLVMAMSAGAVLGALAYGAWGSRLRPRSVFVGALVGTAAALLGMAVLPPYPVMVALGALVGVLYGPVNPLVNLAMQTRAPERLRGRVVGVLTSAAYAAGPLGYLAAGPLVEALGVRPAFLTITAALLAVALAAVPMRALHDLDRLDPGTTAVAAPVAPRSPPAPPAPSVAAGTRLARRRDRS